LLVPTFILFAGWACWAGCGAGAGGSGLGGEGGTGAQGTGGDGNAGWNPGDEDGGLQDGEICEAEELDSQPVELDMFLVIDRSGSMSGTLWTGTVNALNSFIADPLSAGINLGMNFFPPIVGSGNCVVGEYNPLQHPQSIPPLFVIGTDNTEISNILNGAGTAGVTPMYAALDGTYQVASTWQSTYPSHKTIVVLTGDGEPNSCSSLHGTDEISACAGLAGAAYSGTGIETYCIVLDSSAMAALTAVAQQGGTTTPYNISGNVSQFAQVMTDIRDQALGCEFIIPAPTETDFDPTKVNVTYYPGGVGEGQPIPQVANEQSCGAGPGWYFDNPQTPTRIILCPSSCQLVESDLEPKVSIQFGCPTQTR
jgi:hypothetical protein